MTGGTPVKRRAFLAAAAGTATAGGYVGQVNGTVGADRQDRSGRVEGVVRLKGDPRQRASTDGLVAGLKHGAGRAQRGVVDQIERTPGMAVRRQFWLANAVAVSVDTDLAGFAELAARGDVDRIHRVDTGPGRTRTAVDGADGPAPQTTGDVSYGLEMMHVPDVWERFDTRGEGATVAVIDTGVDPTHPDIDLAAWAEFDADGQRVDSDPHDPQGHGTGMSSLVVGGDESGTQIGVAPGAELLVARQDPEGRFTSTVAALEWAVENGADAVSMSFDFGPLAAEGIEPFENAIAAGTVPVPAGFGPDLFLAPGAYATALTAGAVDSELAPFHGGNGGEIRTERYWRSGAVPDDWPDRYLLPDVVTAGVDVLTAVPDNDEFDGGHRRSDGFSNGPPHVAGVVALLRSLDEELTPDEIKRILTATARQPGEPFERPDPNGDFGHGIVNAAAAAAEVAGRPREVSGVVTDPDGAPVAGATVTAVSGATAETGDEGHYSLAVPAGEATLTASATGYEPVTGPVTPGSGRDVSFEAERRPDIRLAARPPERIAPGDTVGLEFEVEHAEFATVFVGDGGVAVDPGGVTVAIDGEPAPVGEPAELSGEATLRIDLEVDAGARGLLAVDVSLADGEQNASIEVGPVHVHEQPLRVAGSDDVQRAVAVAAPETTVSLAGDRFELPASPTDSPLPEPRYANPIVEQTRNDAAGLLVDKPIELVAGDGHEPTLVLTGAGSDGRTVGVQVASHFATVDGVDVAAEGATAAVSVLDGDGVHLRNLGLSGATTGVLSQVTKSLVVGGSTITAAEYGVALRDFSTNALIEDNTISDAETGVFLTGRAGDKLFDVEASVSGNTFDGVGTDIRRSGPATILDSDGDRRGTDPTAPSGSMLDLLLYGVTATAVGALFYPALRRRLR
jgi:hypothetical protein